MTWTDAPMQDDTPRWPKGLLILIVLLAVAAPLAMYSRRIPGCGEFDYPIYFRLLFFNDLVNSSAMLVTFSAALAVPPLRSWVARLAALMSRHPSKASAAAFVALALAARIVYQDFPLAMDEFAPMLQARIFAAGHLAITYPPELLDRMVVPGFQGSFILVNHETGQAASGYWPGLALLMTPFALFGGEWLLNPLLGSLGLWLIGDLARQASGQEAARGWAMLAALASPQYTVNALSFYAMTGLLTLNLLYLWSLLRASWRSTLLAGAVGSVALVMHNPVPHALFAVPVGVWLVVDKERRRQILPLIAGYLPLTASLCLGWPVLMDSMGLRATAPAVPANAGFFDLWGQKLGQIFVMPDIELVRVRAYALWKTMIWTAPGLLLMALLAKPKTNIQRILLAAFLLSFVFYFFVPYDQGHGWGYRYIHQAWGMIAISAGICATSCDESTRPRRALIAAAICAGLIATPFFLKTSRETIVTSIEQQPPLSQKGLSIVFITNLPNLYTVDLVRNYPRDQGKVLRMISHGPERDRALIEKLFPSATLLNMDYHGSSWIVGKSAHASLTGSARNSPNRPTNH